MSEKISMEVLLPVAFELYKVAPGKIKEFNAKTDEERLEKLLRQADDFAIFCNHLRRKLEDEGSF